MGKAPFSPQGSQLFQLLNDSDSGLPSQIHEASGWENLKVSGALSKPPKSSVLSVAEGILQGDPVFNLKDHYFMTQDQLYEAAVQKAFHLEMLAQRLGWSEDSLERTYAKRCLSRVGPPERLACNPQAQKTVPSAKEDLLEPWGARCPFPPTPQPV